MHQVNYCIIDSSGRGDAILTCQDEESEPGISQRNLTQDAKRRRGKEVSLSLFFFSLLLLLFASCMRPINTLPFGLLAAIIAPILWAPLEAGSPSQTE
jgi:hypothetical protein